jgi:hypothetical protein
LAGGRAIWQRGWYVGDGGAPPWVLREEARRAGLDVVAVTNHNQALTGRLAAWAAGWRNGPIMIAGEEVTGANYHLIAVGVRRGVSGNQPAARAIEAIHAQGGVAIAAHPTHDFRGWTDEAVTMLDGAEAAHPIMQSREDARRELVAFQERARGMNPRLAPIGSSDVHMTSALGVCRTYVFVRDVSAAAVLDALRNGMTVAVDMKDRLYGRPDLVQLVRNRRPGGRIDPHPGYRRLSTALALIALPGLLLAGRRRS